MFDKSKGGKTLSVTAVTAAAASLVIVAGLSMPLTAHAEVSKTDAVKSPKADGILNGESKSKPFKSVEEYEDAIGSDPLTPQYAYVKHHKSGDKKSKCS